MPKNDIKNPVLSHNVLEFENLVYFIRDNWGCIKTMFDEFSSLSMQEERSTDEEEKMQSLSSGIDVSISSLYGIFKSFSTLHSCFNSCSCFNADCVCCYNFGKCKDLGCLHLSDISVETAEQKNHKFFNMLD